MAREKVEKIQCDRCKRAELRTLAPNTPDIRPPDFEASFLGQKLVYADLCEKCRETLQNIWKDLAEWDREVKYTVIPTKLSGPDQAPPLATAPNYTPPQPNSAAGAKR
jgi:hypothetical protein